MQRQRALQRGSKRASSGSVKLVATLVLSALGVTVAIAWRMLNAGATHLSYVLGMSFACVVGMAIAAPGFFRGKSREPADFSEEIDKLHADDIPGEPVKRRKWK